MFRNLPAMASSRAGNVVLTFALAMPVAVALMAAAVNFSEGNWQRAAAQTALDSASLGAVIQFNDGTATQDQMTATARALIASKATRFKDLNDKSTVTINATEKSVEINYASTVPLQVPFVIWNGSIPVKIKSKAKLNYSMLPVCIMVTDPTQKHTFLGVNDSHTNLSDCLVQVNTQNWDAVEMRGTSYLHASNGQNCFVGDIHYGDVQPGKAPVCTFFPDPFASMTIPAPSATCKTVQHSGAFTPGTYCGGLTITGGATLAKGVYIVKDGPLKISGTGTAVTATGVTFILTGTNAGLDINTTGSLNFTAASSADAGQFAGFVFFLDPASAGGGPGKKSKGIDSTIASARMTLSGIVYLAGQKFNITNRADLTVSPGAIIADFILPDDANLTLYGTLNSTTAAEQALQKIASDKGSAALVK